MAKKYKAINFDLDTKKLKDIYSKQTKKAYNTAYSDIESFMLDNQFTHRQGSGYISNMPLSDADVVSLGLKLKSNFPWLLPCSKKIDLTVIEKQFDLIDVMTGLEEDDPVKRNIKNNINENENHSKEVQSLNKKDITASAEEYGVLEKKYNDLFEANNTLLQAAKKKNDVISITNLVFNEHPELKEAFKKAKAETLQKMEKKGENLNNKKSEKISSPKASKHKNELRL